MTSANVACGLHAGDALTMRATVARAQRHGVAVGAHPGYDDRGGFGRRPKQLTAHYYRGPRRARYSPIPRRSRARFDRWSLLVKLWQATAATCALRLKHCAFMETRLAPSYWRPASAASCTPLG